MTLSFGMRTVWQWLDEQAQEAQGAPSMQEIARGTGYAKQTVIELIDKLEARGLVCWKWNNARRVHRGLLWVTAFDPTVKGADRKRKYDSVEAYLEARRARRRVRYEERRRVKAEVLSTLK